MLKKLIFALFLLPVAAFAQAPTISPLQPIVTAGGATQTFTVTSNPGTGGAWTCANNGGACLGSINSGTGVYTPPATMAAQQSVAGYQLLPNDHVINTNISALPARTDGANFTIASAPTGAVRNGAGTVATITFSPGTTTAIGTPIVITGVTDSTFNGTYTVTSGCGGNCTTVTMANSGTPNATSGGGTLTIPWASGMGTTTLNFLPSFPYNYTNASTPTTVMTSFTYTPGNQGETFSVPTCPTLNIESSCGDAINNTVNVDHHFIGMRTDTGQVSEFYQINNGLAFWTSGHSQSGVQYNYSDYALPGGGNGTTDAAGLPLLPLTLRSSEVANACANSATINHALRVTVANGYLNNSHIWPATTNANEPGINPYGQRFRLKAAYDISGFSACAQTVLTALKNYGVILADGGLGWQAVVAFDDANPTVAQALQAISNAHIAVTNWETVDESSLEETALSGATTTGEVVTYTSSTGTASTNVDLQGTNLDVPRNQIYIAAGTPQQLLPVYTNGAITCTMSPTEGSISANASGCLYTAPGSIGSETDTTITVTSSAVGSMTGTMLVHIFPITGMRILSADTSNYTDSMANVWYAGGANGYGLSNAPRWSGSNNPSITGTDKQLWWNSTGISGVTADYKIDFLVPNGTYTFTLNRGTGGSGDYYQNLFAQGGFLGTVNPIGLVGYNAKWTYTTPMTVINNALSFYINGTAGAGSTAFGAAISSYSIVQNSTTIPSAPILKSILVN